MNNTRKNRIKDEAFKYFGIFCTLLGLLLLALFIGNILIKGLARIDWDFITGLPSRFPERAGIFSAFMGTLWMMFLTGLIAIPLGVSAAIYLEEYSKKSRMGNILELNISNLAGVPSIIYGILGLEVFSRTMHLGGSVLAGSLTLALLILPIIIVATREAIKAVPSTIREGSYALGASKWQTIWLQLLPTASGGIITGIILALARAIGEAAPLVVAGAMVYVPFAPSSPMDEYSVLPIQVFNWISRPQKGFEINAAAGIIILLAITFIMNGIAVFFRNRMQKKLKW
jgi:phosphate transport system permease protein